MIREYFSSLGEHIKEQEWFDQLHLDDQWTLRCVYHIDPSILSRIYCIQHLFPNPQLLRGWSVFLNRCPPNRVRAEVARFSPLYDGVAEPSAEVE